MRIQCIGSNQKTSLKSSMVALSALTLQRSSNTFQDGPVLAFAAIVSFATKTCVVSIVSDKFQKVALGFSMQPWASVSGTALFVFCFSNRFSGSSQAAMRLLLGRQNPCRRQRKSSNDKHNQRSAARFYKHCKQRAALGPSMWGLP